MSCSSDVVAMLVSDLLLALYCSVFLTFLTNYLQVEMCDNKTEKDFLESPPEILEAAANLPYPELHQEWSEMRFYTALRDIFENLGYDHFSFRDLFAPTKKRYQVQLSAFINFAKFREEQLQFYQELSAPVRTELVY